MTLRIERRAQGEESADWGRALHPVLRRVGDHRCGVGDAGAKGGNEHRQ